MEIILYTSIFLLYLLLIIFEKTLIRVDKSWRIEDSEDANNFSIVIIGMTESG